MEGEFESKMSILKMTKFSYKIDCNLRLQPYFMEKT